MLTNDELIDRANQDVVPHFSLTSERHVNATILFNEWENAPKLDVYIQHICPSIKSRKFYNIKT